MIKTFEKFNSNELQVGDYAIYNGKLIYGGGEIKWINLDYSSSKAISKFYNNKICRVLNITKNIFIKRALVRFNDDIIFKYVFNNNVVRSKNVSEFYVRLKDLTKIEKENWTREIKEKEKARTLHLNVDPYSEEEWDQILF